MTLIQKITDKVQDLPLEASPTQKDIDNYYLTINNLVKITDEFAIGFAEWSVARAMGFDSFKLNDGELEIYKKQKGL